MEYGFCVFVYRLLKQFWVDFRLILGISRQWTRDKMTKFRKVRVSALAAVAWWMYAFYEEPSS